MGESVLVKGQWDHCRITEYAEKAHGEEKGTFYFLAFLGGLPLGFSMLWILHVFSPRVNICDLACLAGIIEHSELTAFMHGGRKGDILLFGFLRWSASWVQGAL